MPRADRRPGYRTIILAYMIREKRRAERRSKATCLGFGLQRRGGPADRTVFNCHDRPRVSYRIVGSAISGPQLTQEPKLLARKSPSRGYRRPSGATSPAANPPQL